MPTRRRLLVAALAAAPLLASCGFALRKTPEFHFQTIALAMPSTALGQQLRRQLGNAGSVRLSDKPAKAEIVFESAGERRINEILSRNADGEVRERLLGIVITFRVRTGNGRELLPLTEIERQIERHRAANHAPVGQRAPLSSPTRSCSLPPVSLPPT